MEKKLLKEISEEERNRVLATIGTFVVIHALEGLIIASHDSLVVKWNEAEIWVTKNAPKYGVEADVLHVILYDAIKASARKAIEER